MAGIPSDVNVLEMLEHKWFAHLLTVVAVGLSTYDILINLDVEIKYIWARLWTFIPAAFDPTKRPTLQRYMPLMDRVVFDSYVISGAPDTRACLISNTLSGCKRNSFWFRGISDENGRELSFWDLPL
ncbi:hypothetical protein L218DRAFT_951085 [Marasmius fiardii PR-910]|nr:hypothetical protein L218DRAFT_951085 [Marasmius fiardii PR-910]